MDFNGMLEAGLARDATQPMLEYRGRSFTRGEVAALGEQVCALLDVAGLADGDAIGLVTRNRPLVAATILGLMRARRMLTTIYAMQSPAAIGADITRSRFGAVIADIEDWSPQVRAAAAGTGSIGIMLDLSANPPIALLPGLERPGEGPFRHHDGEPGLEILSSGTTGPPKRVLLPFRMMHRAVLSAQAGRPANGTARPEILTWPLSGIGGICNLTASAVIGRPLIVLEKFNVPEWLDAVRRHRPAAINGTPAVARMILDAGVAPADLAGVQTFNGGGAAMTPELQDEFERTYDIKVLWAYGATEFCGTVISWTHDLYDRFRESKRGAMGVALPGVSLRTVDMVTGAPLPMGGEGYLEALVPELGGDAWIRTTDIAQIDEDGFVFHRGRGDGAILRGGFKVLPETIVTALLAHPAVLDAGVVGIAEARLGAVPVAAVELRAGAARIDEDALRGFLRERLVVHHVPAHILILDRLPRTTSLKVDLGAIRTMFEQKPVAA